MRGRGRVELCLIITEFDDWGLEGAFEDVVACGGDLSLRLELGFLRTMIQSLLKLSGAAYLDHAMWSARVWSKKQI
jgi:hypothetical protein